MWCLYFQQIKSSLPQFQINRLDFLYSWKSYFCSIQLLAPAKYSYFVKKLVRLGTWNTEIIFYWSWSKFLTNKIFFLSFEQFEKITTKIDEKNWWSRIRSLILWAHQWTRIRMNQMFMAQFTYFLYIY